MSPPTFTITLASIIQGASSSTASAFAFLFFIPAAIALALVSYVVKTLEEAGAGGGEEEDEEEEEREDVIRRLADVRAYLQRVEAAAPCPLDAVVVEMIPVVNHKDSPSDPHASCVVCLCTFEEVDMLKMLPPCGHCFHVTCIDKWFETHSTCPLCRREISLPFPSAGEIKATHLPQQGISLCVHGQSHGYAHQEPRRATVACNREEENSLHDCGHCLNNERLPLPSRGETLPVNSKRVEGSAIC